MKQRWLKYFIPFLLSPMFVVAQYQNIPVKEEFDLYNEIRVFGTSYNPCEAASNNDGGVFGDGMSKILEGYVTMYKTTGDKAYLYKFVLQSLCMMENRHDLNPAADNSEPRWVSDPNMYKDGYIIAAFARFIYLIKNEEPSLFTTPLYHLNELKPANYQANTCNCNKFGITFSTFGQYANWLQGRVDETLWWYLTNGYWSNSWGLLQEPSSNATGAAINMQVGFGRALMFIGLTETEASFLAKAQIIANLYRGNVDFSDPCENQVYSDRVLPLTNDNAYWWYHAGWSRPRRDCFFQTGNFTKYDKYSTFIEFIDDISHGAIVTWLPLDFYNFQPNTPFTTTDIIRFRNMFTKHIYDGLGGFYNAVDGTDNHLPNDPCDTSHNPNITVDCPHNYFRLRAMNYMPFAEFDGADATATPPDVYNIIMDYYVSEITGNTGFSYTGQDNKGHAEVVLAQWERECPDLTIYNRDVVYDQDFFAKGMLTIAPQQIDYRHQTGDNPYAEPLIYLDNGSMDRFVVEPGTSVNMSAANTIVLKPGTHIKAGSNFHAYIDPSLCVNSNRTGHTNKGRSTDIAASQNAVATDSTASEAKKAPDKEMSATAHSALNIYPNPTTGKLRVDLVSDADAGFQVSGLPGNILQKGMLHPGQSTVDFSSYPAGVYLMLVQTNTKVFRKRVVLEH